MFYYLVTAHFLLTQTIKYSYQCINLSKTQNDSNTPSNLTALLKVNKIYFLTNKCTYVVISMTGRFSTDYTSSVHVMIGKKPVQQSMTKTKWFEVLGPTICFPTVTLLILSSILDTFFLLFLSFFFFSFFSILSTHISIVSIYCLTHIPVTRY